MAKFKKIAKIIGGTVLVALGATVIKKLYDDYRIFNDFDVEDINNDEDKELDLDSFGNDIWSGDGFYCEDEDEDEDEDDCEFDDGDIEEEFSDDEYSVGKDTESDICEDEDDEDIEEEFSDDEYSAEEDEFWEEDDEEYEEEYSEPSDSDEEYEEPSDFEKVTKATREDAIKFILSKDKTYSDVLLADLSDQALAEIYVSLL